jgi:hypothetical protein
MGLMRIYTNRRTKLGKCASAALPVLWAEMERRGWSDADLAREVDIDNGNASRIVYGDRRPGRVLSSKLFARLGIGLDLWDQPCPVKKRIHPVAVAAEVHAKAS